MTMPHNLRQAINSCEIWLNELEDKPMIHSPEDAYAVLRAVLQTLRDRLPVDEAVHLGSQLPMIVRGIYFEGWKPSQVPVTMNEQEFYDCVREKLNGHCANVDNRTLSRCVFDILNHHITPGQVDHVRQQLPRELQAQWPDVIGHA